jgi:hypothetical protein
MVNQWRNPASGLLRLGRQLDEPPPLMTGFWLGLGKGGLVLLLQWWELRSGEGGAGPGGGIRPPVLLAVLLGHAGDKGMVASGPSSEDGGFSQGSPHPPSLDLKILSPTRMEGLGYVREKSLAERSRRRRRLGRRRPPWRRRSGTSPPPSPVLGWKPQIFRLDGGDAVVLLLWKASSWVHGKGYVSVALSLVVTLAVSLRPGRWMVLAATALEGGSCGLVLLLPGWLGRVATPCSRVSYSASWWFDALWTRARRQGSSL